MFNWLYRILAIVSMSTALAGERIRIYELEEDNNPEGEHVVQKLDRHEQRIIDVDSSAAA